MRICLLMGRGVEGCGVTRFTIELQAWLVDQDQDVTVVASTDKRWTRLHAHPELEYCGHNFARGPLDLSSYDVVVVNSLPSEAHPAHAQGAFAASLESYGGLVVLVQHDHSVHSINRNACLDEAVRRADLLFCHSLQNDFARFAQGKELEWFQPGMRLPKEPRDEVTHHNHHRWLGRTTSWKGYNEMTDLHVQHLAGLGGVTVLEGLERSIAWSEYKKRNYGHYVNRTTSKSQVEVYDRWPEDAERDRGDAVDSVVCYGPFARDAALDRTARCGFGYQLSRLDERYIHRSLEYSHLEIAASGACPVFHSCYKRALGDDCGVVWHDPQDAATTTTQITRCLEDEALRRAHCEIALEALRAHQSSEAVFPRFWSRVEDALNKRRQTA